MEYNLYYKNVKINKKPINELDVLAVYKRNTIYKHDEKTNSVYAIPTKKIRCVKHITI